MFSLGFKLGVRYALSLTLLVGLGLRLAAGNSLGPVFVALVRVFTRSSLQAHVGRKLLGAVFVFAF